MCAFLFSDRTRATEETRRRSALASFPPIASSLSDHRVFVEELEPPPSSKVERVPDGELLNLSEWR